MSLFFFLVVDRSAEAQVNHQFFTAPEALAMGNAFVAVADGATSMFYNPAALARVKKFAFMPFHGGVGATNNFASAIRAATSNNGVVDRINALSGKKLHTEVFAFPSVQLPFFGFGVLLRARAQNYIRNPVYNTISSQVFMEYGLVMGVAFPLIPGLLDFGLSAKFVDRRKALVFDDVDPDDLISAIQNGTLGSQFRKGKGYSSNAGLSLKIPTGMTSFEPVFGLGFEDIGTLTFRNGNNPRPQRIEQSLNVGMALNYNIPYAGRVTLAVDVRRLMKKEIEIPQKLHIGLRWRSPALATIMAGISGGYLTAGISLNFKLVKLNFVTYEEELGTYAGARGDRRYLIEGSMGFEFDGFSLKLNKRRR